MQLSSVNADIGTAPLVSLDGIAEFTESTGAFHREYGNDADPLLEWGARSREWINSIRRQFGKRLRHIAVVSKYQHKQFSDSAWGDKLHPLDALCMDDTYRRVTIDDSSLSTVVTKTENDATTSQEFMETVRGIQEMVLIGVTTTTCIDLTIRYLFPNMRSSEIPLQKIIMAADGFASRKSRRSDHDRIIQGFREEDDRLVIVPHLEDIRWVGEKP